MISYTSTENGNKSDLITTEFRIVFHLTNLMFSRTHRMQSRHGTESNNKNTSISAPYLASLSLPLCLPLLKINKT